MPSAVGPIDRHQLLQLAGQLHEATIAALYEGSTLVSALDECRLELERLLMLSEYPSHQPRRAVVRAQMLLNARHQRAELASRPR